MVHLVDLTLLITNDTRSGSFFDGFGSLDAPLASFLSDHIKTFDGRVGAAQVQTPPPKARRTGPSPRSATPAPPRRAAKGSQRRATPAPAVASPAVACLALTAGEEPSEADLLKLAAGAAALPPKKNAQRDIMRSHQIAGGVASAKVKRKFSRIGEKLGIVKKVTMQ